MLLHRGRNRDDNVSKSPGPTFINVEQAGQQPFANNVTRNSSPLKFLLSSPIQQSGKMKDSQDTWTAGFLTDLRSNRPARPSGARPLPVRHAHTTPIPTLEPPARTASALSRPSFSKIQPNQAATTNQESFSSSTSHCRAKSALSMREQAGRPLVQQPFAEVDPHMTNAIPVPDSEIDSKKAPDTVLSGTYMESGQRWMEKQEARSLRVALEDMDLREEQRLHAAAQEEATDIVWKHRNAGIPYRNPGGPRDYKQHLRKGSHSRSKSIGRYGVLGGVNSISKTTNRSASDGSTSTKSGGDSSERSRVSSGSSLGHKRTEVTEIEFASRSANGLDSIDKKNHINLTFPMPPAKVFNRRGSSGSRTRTTGSDGRLSLFRNPEDQIYEEPEEIVPQILTDDKTTTEIKPLKPKNRNPSIGAKEQTNTIGKSYSVPILEDKIFSRYEIHKNPPSRSRDPSYLRNPLPSTSQESINIVQADTGNNTMLMKDGVEIRSNDIRAATSMRLKDRSPKLPTPTVVSDRPGRPIVSFDRDYIPREVELRHESSFSERLSSRNGMIQLGSNIAIKPQLPASVNSAPVIPTINVLESPDTEVYSQPDAPTISFPDVPSISISVSELPATVSTNVVSTNIGSSARPLPRPINGGRTAHGLRPAPHHSSTAPVTATMSHWTPMLQRATAQCAACALPISGRICGELLECVAFYPEPDEFRVARLARINARLNDIPIIDSDGHHTEEDDGDDGLRFYCHLDFHEKFSPRCRSCKTPIEGEVVIACGGEWHVGHFFCAECGDPFDASTPFVEKDGFAWCVDCHSRRFSGKCAGCRKPITDMVVKALGKEWHERCFCCKECGGEFKDGRFFTRDGSEKPDVGLSKIQFSLVAMLRIARPHYLFWRRIPPLWHAQRDFHASKGLGIVKPFILADIGEGIKEVQIIQWFVEPGAHVEQFDKLCEVQSDKAATEITSRFDGVIKKLHYEAEDMAQVGKPLCDIDIQGDISLEEEALITPPAEQAGEPSDAQQPQKAVQQDLGNPIEHKIGDPLPKRADPRTHASLATPAVRGLLKELAIKIEDIQGTGKDGRVLKDDVQRFATARDAPSQAVKIPAATPIRSTDTGPQKETVIQLTPIQSQMFKTMTRSLSIPHFLFADEINLTALESLRARLNALSSTGRRISYLPFIIKAMSIALKDFPLLNSRVEYDSDMKGVPPRLIVREKHNIGVAMDTPQGLLVPNIKDVGSLSILEIADQLKHLQTLAQASKLTAIDLTGGTITVSNIGSIGGTYVAPIIVQSEVAILGVGRAMVVPAFDKEGGIEKRTVGNFSWSADHRVVDGATMARMGGRHSALSEAARVPYNPFLQSAEPSAPMANAEDRTPGYQWTSAQKAEFKKLSGKFQATPSAAPPAVRRFVRPRAYSPSDRRRPCRVQGPSPPFSAIVASYARRFGPLPHRAPPVAHAAAAAAPAASSSSSTRAATRRAEPYVSGAYAATTAPDRDFFARGPPRFPAGHNHYQVSDELRKAWCTAGSSTDQAQEK
ncbi:hypothetical protein MMC27_003333 [Xylographa pallens]|nr:hypothetical protein [Xylographa pallens]